MGTLYRRNNSPKWYGEYTDSFGKRKQKSTGTTNKRDAAAILAQWEKDANDERHGLRVSPTTTLESLLIEYLAYISGTSEIHRSTSESRIRRVIEALGWTYPRDIDRIQVENIVRTFKTNSGKPISLRTQSHYLTALKAFSKWLTHLRGALPRDTLAGIRKPNFERGRKKRRRYLTPEEWHWLRDSPNALLYETAIQTGLRSSELRALTVANLGTHQGESAIILDASSTKNGQTAIQYISGDLQKRLRNCLPFEMPSPARVADMFYADLNAARIDWLETRPKDIPEGFLNRTNAAGQSLDFHSLRHTCGAWLAIAGVSPKVIQSVMRHSTIVLTLDTYGHLLPGQQQDAAEKLSVILTQDLRQTATRQQPTAKPKNNVSPSKSKAKR